MARQVIHSGSFLGDHSIVWRVDIWQQVDEVDQGDEPGELTFPADEPVVIEWDERGKEEVICGSSCTVKIESPGDRTYIGLYAEKPCSIGCDIYKDDSLYWRGTLDTEQYEEPYERLDMYDVTLTFSDFGVMDRLKFDMDGCTPTLATLLTDALGKAELGDLTVDTSLMSSSLGGTALTLAMLTVNTMNFYDEDGEPNTLYEVVEGILQPLALRIIQKAGKIWVYDLNGLYNENPALNEWSGDSQTLGVDRVYNNIKVTFSPYGDGELMSEDDVEFTDEVDEEEVNYDHSTPTAVRWSFFDDFSPEWGVGGIMWPCFTIHKGDGKGFEDMFKGSYTEVGSDAHRFREAAALEQADSLTSYFRIVAQGGGEDSVGYAWLFRKGGSTNFANHELLGKAWNYVGRVIFATRRVYLPPVPPSSIPTRTGGGRSTRWMLRLKLSMLADVKYNPFGDDGFYNDRWLMKDKVIRYGNYFVHKAHVLLWSAEEGGSVLYHYDNTDIEPDTALSGSCPIEKALVANTFGSWVSGDVSAPKTRLTWYDNTNDERNRKCGIFGWKGNRHTIGRWDNTTISKPLLEAPEGQYIPYPPTGGWIQVALVSGIDAYDGQHEPNSANVSSAIHSNEKVGGTLWWMLYKHPELEIVQGFKYDKVEVDDIEFSAFADADAQEDLELSTICGTLSKAVPCARGAYRLASDGALAYNLTRAGHTDRIERLWLGTLYSQFAERHTKLSGEAYGDHDGLHPYTDAAQGARMFVCTGETLNCITDTAERTLVELSPDEYTASIY